MTKQSFILIKLFAITLGLSSGISYVYAWTAPTALPPTGNVSVSINTSGTAQSKAGSLGIGMTTTPPPATKLQVSNGNIQFDIPATSLANALITWPGGSPNFRLTDALGVEKINVNSQNGSYTYFNSGNVGIGTATPAQKLEVVGNVRATDVCTTTGTCLSTAGGGVPTGAVMYYNLATCPAGWIPANGTAGTPDLRGEFIRGLDSGRGVDAGRTLASWQGDLVKNHTHSYYFREGGYNPWWQYANVATVSNTSVRTTMNDASTGLENRPRNVALLACVKS